MKFTVVLVTLLSITWAVKVKNSEDPKDKREAAVGYGGGGGGHSSHGYSAAPSFGHEDANAISIGAGYSVGGAKPSFSYGPPDESQHQLSSESLPSSGHATIQLAPITLQPSQSSYASSDLSQLMNQLQHGLNTGALQLSPYQESGAQGGHGVQEFAIPQFSLQQYSGHEQGIPSVPSYAAGTKGLGSYSSTGPVLFTPSDPNQNQPGLSYGAPSGGHSFADAGGLSFGHGSLGAFALRDSGHSFGGSSGHSLGESGHSLGGPGFTLGGSGGHSYGGSIKHLGGGYVVPSKAAFKPSTFLGSDGGHGFSGLSGSHGAPSFIAHAPSGGHGLSLGSGGSGHSFGGFGGSAKFIAPSYIPPKTKGFGSSLDSVAAYTSSSHASPPRTTYGHPAVSYSGGPSSSSHAASAHSSPQYYVSSSKFPSFSEGSSFKGSSGHGPLSSFSSGPKYSFSGHSGPSSRYSAPKDIQGAYSETSYNTIKYSEELKPRVH